MSKELFVALAACSLLLNQPVSAQGTAKTLFEAGTTKTLEAGTYRLIDTKKNVEYDVLIDKLGKMMVTDVHSNAGIEPQPAPSATPAAKATAATEKAASASAPAATTAGTTAANTAATAGAAAAPAGTSAAPQSTESKIESLIKTQIQKQISKHGSDIEKKVRGTLGKF